MDLLRNLWFFSWVILHNCSLRIKYFLIFQENQSCCKRFLIFYEIPLVYWRYFFIFSSFSSFSVVYKFEKKKNHWKTNTIGAKRNAFQYIRKKGAKLFVPLVYKNNAGVMKRFKIWTVIHVDIKYYSKLFSEIF